MKNCNYHSFFLNILFGHFYIADRREMTWYEGREMGNDKQQKSQAWCELGTLRFMVTALTTRSAVFHNVIAQMEKNLGVM